MKSSLPCALASSSDDDSSPGEWSDLQSHLRAVQDFIQVNSPSDSAPISTEVASLFPLKLGIRDVILPA